MSHRAWMADAERLMNLMERFDYKSEQYNVCRKVLLSHLAKKPKHDEEATAWTMTGPAPFEFEDDFAPPPVVELDFYLPSEPEPEPEPVTSTAIAAEISDTAAATPATEIATAMAAESVPPAKAKKRRAATKKSTASAEKKPKKAPTDKPKRVRKKATSTKVEPGENPPA